MGNIFQSHPYVVAASTAPPRWKAIARYRCKGDATDAAMIQQAIDDLVAASSTYRGTVSFSPGIFYLTASAQSELVEGTGNIATSETDKSKINVGANYSKFAYADVVYIYGGTPTLESINADGYYYVTKVSGGDLGANEIQLSADINTAITGASYCRPRWAIKVPKQIGLEGVGFLKTVFSLDVAANCCGFFCATTAAAEGGQEFRFLSLQGNAAQQTADKWKTSGLLVGAAYDIHLTDVEIRYWKGTGYVGTTTWGAHMRGAWVEDCDVGMMNPGSLESVKVQDCATNAIRLNQAAMQASNCQVRTNVAGTTAILARGCSSGFFLRGGILEASKGTDCGIEFVDYDGASNVAPIVEGIQFSTSSTSYLVKNAGRVYGGRLSGSLVGVYKPTAFVQNPSLLIGTRVDFSGGNYASAPGADAQIRCVPVYNQSGAIFEVGLAYSWLANSANADAVAGTTGVNDAAFAGVAPQLYTGAGSRGFLICEGYAKVMVDATVPILVQDLLHVSATTKTLSKATTINDTAVAIAKEAKASGTGTIWAVLISPRRVP